MRTERFATPHAARLVAAMLLTAAVASTAPAGIFGPEDFAATPVEGLALYGDAHVADGVLKLTQAGLGGEHWGSAILDDPDPGQAVIRFTARFDVTLIGRDNVDAGFPQGFSFQFGRFTSTNLGVGDPQSGSGVLSEGLAISFDTANNGGGDAGRVIDVFFKPSPDQPYQHIARSAPRRLETDNPAPVTITLDADGRLNLTHGNDDDEPQVFTDLPVPGWPEAVDEDWRFGLGAQGAFLRFHDDNHHVDNLRIETVIPEPATATLLALAALAGPLRRR